MRDGVALLAILARVRRRLRAFAAMEGAVIAGALALGAVAFGFAAVRWRTGAAPATTLRWGLAGALGLVATGGLIGALRAIPLERCATILDRALGGHDRVLSALAFWRAGAGAGASAGAGGRSGPFMAAVIADAAARGATVAPRLAAPFRRPKGVPGLAAAAILLGLAALAPLPARGSRVAAPSAHAPLAPPAPRVRFSAGALDAERDEAAAALRAAGALDDPALAKLARELSAVVKNLAAGELARGDGLDRLADLQRRSDDAADEVAGLTQGLEQAGKALQGAAATHDSGRAIEAQDAPATEKSMNELADKAAEAGAGERSRIAAALDKAGDRARAATAPAGSDSRPPGTQAPTLSNPSGADLSNVSAGPLPPDDAAGPERPERQRRLTRDDQAPRSNRPSPSPSSDGAARAPSERRLQRLERELRESASACRTDPASCRRKLQHQAHALPRMEDEARSAAARQRLAEVVRQLRERLRREGNNGSGGGERAREEKRFMRSARGDSAHKGETIWQEDPNGDAQLYSEDVDSMGQMGDGDGDDSDGDGDGPAADSSGGGHSTQSGGGEEAAAGQASGNQENGTGEGIGNQRGGDPLGERGTLVTRGRAREAQVRNGAGPSRAEVIQSAARRGFAHVTYQGVYTDYRAAVEESLDASAVPPGRRFIVRRYFQLIRPQSPRAPR